MFRSLTNWMAEWRRRGSAIFISRELQEDVMHIFVGQGNPGAKYAGNRHNIGFMALDVIDADHGFGPWRQKFQGDVCEGRIGGKKVLLLKPATFYNETGRSARAAVDFYKLEPDRISVFHDEIDLAHGRVRVKRGGGHSGNNGIRSMIAHCGSEIRRIRLGVGHPGDKSRVMPYVLADFPKSEGAWVEALLSACSRAAHFLVDDLDERFQTEVMRLAPAPKSDPRQRGI